MFLATYVMSLLQAYDDAIRHSELTWISVNIATYFRPSYGLALHACVGPVIFEITMNFRLHKRIIMSRPTGLLNV